MRQVTTYIKGKKDQHDDAPDSLSMFRHLVDDLGYEDNENIDDEDLWPSESINIEQLTL